MQFLIYIIKTVFISGLLLGYYWLFLRHRVFHGFNRFYLLYIPVISFLLPALQFRLPEFWGHADGGSPIRLLGVGRGQLEEAVTIYANRNTGTGFTLEFLLGFLFLVVLTFLSIRLYNMLRYLLRLGKDKPFLQLPEARVFFVTEKGTPFSFFRSIFWGTDMDISSPASEQILRHELFHVQQNHSRDIVCMEIVSILCWFNPFIHFIRREIKIIHEYAADAYAAGKSGQFEYARLLFMKVSGTALPLTNPFFKNQIKKRITMITKSNKNSLPGRILVLPLIALLVCLFSFKIQNHFPLHTFRTMRVVIDAGHGGVDPGSSLNGIMEKDINLRIAKKIQEMSAKYQVDVILTREKDELPGKGDDISTALKYRADMPGRENADLFISIHTNGTGKNKMQDEYSGFDIYVPGADSKVYAGSVKLASVIAEFIRPDYTMSPELKQRNGGVFILDKASVPSILIECGYIDNRYDIKCLMDNDHQEKIARDILEGIQKYGAQSQYSASVSSQPSSANGQPPTAKETVYKHSEITANSIDSGAPLKKVEVLAQYPGGSGGWNAYLSKNLNYPDEAVNKEIQGDVIVEFIVQEDGTVSDIHAISGPSALRKESVKVIAQSGKWIPAKDKGMVVASYVKQPINYRLSVK
jgi:TonB family protein